MKDRIKLVRTEYPTGKLSMKDIGKKIGVSYDVIYNWENGRGIPSEAQIIALCAATGCDEVWLRTGLGDGPYPYDSSTPAIAMFADAIKDSAGSRKRIKDALDSAPDWLAPTLEMCIIELAKQYSKK